MKSVSMFAAGAVLGAAGFLGAQAPCTPVAFVNFNQAFKAYPRAAKIVNDLNAEADKAKAALADREKEVKAEFQNLDTRYDPGTPEWEAGRRKLKLLAAEIQFDREAGAELINRKQVKGMAAVYKEIAAEAQRIASAKGYASVINIDTDPVTVEEKGQMLSLTELKLQMALRTAVWCDPAHDLTKEVIEALSKEK
jgi:Skp family chaperone for outer membrane proteins